MAIIIDNTRAGILNISNPHETECGYGDHYIPRDGTDGQVLTMIAKSTPAWKDPVYPQMRELLGKDRTYFVGVHGDDANTGLTADASLLTIQQALLSASQVDGNGYNVVIQLLDGIYDTSFVIPSMVGVSSLIIQGNPITPTDVTITHASGSIIYHQSSTNVVVRDFQIEGLEATCIVVDGPGSRLTIDDGIVFGSAATHIQCSNGAYVRIAGNYSIAGTCVQHQYITSGSYLHHSNNTITLVDTPIFLSAFIMFDQASSVTHFGCEFNGVASGKRFVGGLNAVMQTYGSGANYLPGTIQGTVTTGAQYA